jgi:hypothetical protein
VPKVLPRVGEKIPLVIYEFDRFEFIGFGVSVVPRGSSGLGQPLSRTFYVGGEIVDETALDGSEAISRVEKYCDGSHGVTETMGSMIRGCSRQV